MKFENTILYNGMIIFGSFGFLFWNMLKLLRAIYELSFL